MGGNSIPCKKRLLQKSNRNKATKAAVPNAAAITLALLHRTVE